MAMADMPNTARHRAESIERLEQGLELCLVLCEAADKPIVRNLLERALDEVRAAQHKGLPKLKQR